MGFIVYYEMLVFGDSNHKDPVNARIKEILMHHYQTLDYLSFYRHMKN